MNQCATKHPKAQPLQERLARFVERLLRELDEQLDKRLVRPFLLTLLERVMHFSALSLAYRKRREAQHGN